MLPSGAVGPGQSLEGPRAEQEEARLTPPDRAAGTGGPQGVSAMPVCGQPQGGPPAVWGVQLLWKKQGSSFLLSATLQVMVRSDPQSSWGIGR